MFDFLPVVNVRKQFAQAQEQARKEASDADTAAKAQKAEHEEKVGQTHENEAEATAQQQAMEQAAQAPHMDPLDRSQSLALLRQLKEKWESLLKGGDGASTLGKEASTYLQQLANLDSFNVQDLDLLRKMSQLKAKDEQPGAEKAGKGGETKENQPEPQAAQKALQQLRDQIRRLSATGEPAKTAPPETTGPKAETKPEAKPEAAAARPEQAPPPAAKPLAPPRAPVVPPQVTTPAPQQAGAAPRPGEARGTEPGQPWLLRMEKLPPGKSVETQTPEAQQAVRTRLRTGGPPASTGTEGTPEGGAPLTRLKLPPKPEAGSVTAGPLPARAEQPPAPKAEARPPEPPKPAPAPASPPPEPPAANLRAETAKAEARRLEIPKAESRPPEPPKPQPELLRTAPPKELKLPPKPEVKAEQGPPQAGARNAPGQSELPPPGLAGGRLTGTPSSPLGPPPAEPKPAAPQPWTTSSPPLEAKPQHPQADGKPRKLDLPPRPEAGGLTVTPPAPQPNLAGEARPVPGPPPSLASEGRQVPGQPPASQETKGQLPGPRQAGVSGPETRVDGPPPRVPGEESRQQPAPRLPGTESRIPGQPDSARPPGAPGQDPHVPHREGALQPKPLPHADQPDPAELRTKKPDLPPQREAEPAKPKPFQPLTTGQSDALERIARQRQEKAQPKEEAAVKPPEPEVTAVDLRPAQGPTRPAEAPGSPSLAPDRDRPEANRPREAGRRGETAEDAPLVRSSFLSPRKAVEAQLHSQAPQQQSKPKEKDSSNPLHATDHEEKREAGAPRPLSSSSRGGASGPPIQEIRGADKALSGSVGKLDDDPPPRQEPPKEPAPRPELLRSRDPGPTSRFLTPAPKREEAPPPPAEAAPEPPTLGPVKERHAVRPADPFGSLGMSATPTPPKPDPRVDPRNQSWLHPNKEEQQAEVHRVPGQEWRASATEAAHLMQAVLPGETRRVITQRRPEDNLFLGPTPPRGPSTGGRPVTGNIPIYNPTLDQVWAGAGTGKRSGNSDKIEGIKMTLSGSAGTMDDNNPWQQMPLRNPGTLSTMRDLRRAHDLNRDLGQNEDTPHRWAREAPQESHTLMGMMTSASAPPPPMARELRPVESPKTEGHPEGSSQVVEATGEKSGGGGGGGGGGQGEGGEGEHEEGRAHAQERQRQSSRPSQGQTVVEKGRLENLRQARENENLRLQMSRHTAPNSRQMADMASRVACHSIEALLKKAYRDQELDQLDEESAVNTLCLVLKMGGEFTYAHSARVLEMAMELADEYGITDEKTRRQIKGGCILKDIGEMGLLMEGEDDEKLNAMAEFMSGEDMRRAGILHDIGKIRIPNEILYKPGKLTEEEYNIMKMHPIYGEQIVYPIASLRHLCPTIRGHHERWDGKGYPDMMKGEEIPLPARVIAVADVYDALAAERPYKAGMPIEKVRGILLEGRGSHFDPELIDAYMRVLDRRYPELARQRRKAGG